MHFFHENYFILFCGIGLFFLGLSNFIVLLLKTPSSDKIIALLINAGVHDKTNKMTCVPSEDSGQPVHRPSPISVFTLYSVESKGPKISLGRQ